MRLTLEAVEKIRALLAQDKSQRAIAAETGYSLGTVGAVAAGKEAPKPRWDRPGSDQPGPNDPTPEAIAAMCREFRRQQPRPFIGFAPLTIQEVTLCVA